MSVEYGSLWRTWDLHVHTPLSLLHQNYNLDNTSEQILKEAFGESTYKELSSEEKQMLYFVKQLYKKAIKKGIVAVGITDYFFIDGYKYIRKILDDTPKLELLFRQEIVGDEEYLEKIKAIKLFPNVEFRTSVISDGAKLQIHVLFSDELSCEDIEQNFLNTLQLSTPDPNNTYLLTKENVRRIGVDALKRKVSGKGNELKVGANSIAIKLEDIRKLVSDSKFKNKAIIILAEEDQSKILWSGQAGFERAKYYQYSDAIFTSNEKTMTWCTSDDCIETINKKLPYLWGSDAHDFEKIFEFDNHRNLWIKADVTFDGLLYALFRFENRIFIGKEPDEFKTLRAREFYTIKNLSVLPNKDDLKREWFNSEIKFNPYMTTIIGNKGSGKSAVSDIVAYLANSHKMLHASFLRKDRFLDKKTNYGNDFNASLSFYGDREVISKTELDSDFDINKSEVVKYLPQSYIEEICNNLDDKFQDEINNTIFSYVPIHERASVTNLIDLINIKTKALDDNIQNILFELRETNDAIVSLEKKATNSYKIKVENDLQKLKEKKNNLLKQKPQEVKEPSDISSSNESQMIISLKELISGFSNEIDEIVKKLILINQKLLNITEFENEVIDINKTISDVNHKYHEFLTLEEKEPKDLLELKIKDRELQQIKKLAEDEKTDLDKKLSESLIDLDTFVDDLEEVTLEKATSRIEEFESYYEKIAYLEMVITHLEKEITQEQQEYFEYKKAFEEWNSYLQMLEGDIPNEVDNTSVKSLEAELNYINNDLAEELNQKRNYRKDKVRSVYREIQAKKKVLEEIYYPVQKKLESMEALKNNNIKFESSIVLDKISYQSDLLSYIDLRLDSKFRGDKGTELIRDLLDSTDFNDEESVIAMIESIFDAIEVNVNDLDRLIKNRNKFYGILSGLEHFEPKFTITSEGKSLNELSPGERGIVLLIFYLVLDRENIPLLIDQPEDNLDNQSVFSKLVPAIMEAKRNRQIIVVTHNPNIAIACDSEGIIFCSQSTINQSLEYVSGSIENPAINKHIVDVLEGTVPAFDIRRYSYRRVD